MELKDSIYVSYASVPVKEVWLNGTLVWSAKGFVWAGLGANNNWTTPANWVNSTMPTAYSSLYFAGTTRLSAFNDFTTDTSFSNITFNAGSGSFQLSGNRFILNSGRVTNNSSNPQTINNDIKLGPGTNIFDTNAGDITLKGMLSGTGFGLTKLGNGTLYFTASSTYTGTTRISAGTLQLGNGSSSITTTGLASPIINSANGTFVYGLANTSGGIITTLPLSFYSGSGNLTISTTVGSFSSVGNMNIDGNLVMSGPQGAISQSFIPGGASRTITAKNISFTGLNGEIGANSNTWTFVTSAVNGPIYINPQIGAFGRLYGNAVIANAGTGPLTFAGNNGFLGGFYYGNGGQSVTLTGAITATSTGNYWTSPFTFNVTGNGVYNGSMTLSGNATFNVSNGITFTTTTAINGAIPTLTKTGLGTLALGSVAQNYGATSVTTISQGTITASKTTGGFTGNAEFTPTTLTVDFGGSTPTSGLTFKYFPGSTSPSSLTVSLTNAGGKTATWSSSTSTLTIN